MHVSLWSNSLLAPVLSYLDIDRADTPCNLHCQNLQQTHLPARRRSSQDEALESFEKRFWHAPKQKKKNICIYDSNQSLLAPSHASQQSLQWGSSCAFQIYAARNVDASPPAFVTYMAFRLAILVCIAPRRARGASRFSCQGSLDSSYAAQTMTAATNYNSHT